MGHSPHVPFSYTVRQAQFLPARDQGIEKDFNIYPKYEHSKSKVTKVACTPNRLTLRVLSLSGGPGRALLVPFEPDLPKHSKGQD